MSGSNETELILRGQVTEKTVLDPESWNPVASLRAAFEGGQLTVTDYRFDDRRVVDLSDFRIRIQRNRGCDPLACLCTALDGEVGFRELPDRRGKAFAGKTVVLENHLKTVRLELSAHEIPESYDFNGVNFLVIYCDDLAQHKVS